MKDFKLNCNTLKTLAAEIGRLVVTGKSYRVSVVEWRDKRSLSQNSLQHSVYTELSKYLISKGRKDWTPKKVKFEMKNNFLGWEQTECTNIHTGEITIKETLKCTSGLDKGESYHYTTQVLDFAQSIGCTIRIPAKCDYRELMEQQNN